MKSNGLMFDFSWGLRIFPVYHVRDKTKNIFFYLVLLTNCSKKSSNSLQIKAATYVTQSPRILRMAVNLVNPLFLVIIFRLVFDINYTDNHQARASSSKSYNLTEQEKDAIEELRLWALQKESLNKKFVITNLKDLSTSQTFVNLLCQVVSKSYTEASNGIALTLWDGSPPACQSTSVEPLSEQGELKSEELIHKSAGKCVEVFLYDNHVEGEVRKVSPGNFVCIRNVHIKELEASADMTTDKPEVTYLIIS